MQANVLRLVVAMAAVLVLGPPGRAFGQADAGFQIIRDWDADNSRTESTGDTLRLASGTIWSPRAYNDFVLRFDYRPLAPTGRGLLRLRATVLPDRNVRSYEAALERGAGRGRLDGARQTLHELRFTPSRPIEDASTWIAVEARAEQDRLTIRLDGVTVAMADRTESFYGTIGLEAAKGGLELRGMRVAILNVPSALDPALPRAGTPGITTPKALRSAYPSYTRAAMKARAQGVARLEFVIEADGSTGLVRVLEAPHPDLALASVACLRKWRFSPPLKDGVPTAIIATMELSYRLK
jgi:TonB family protein